jgi:dihydroxyacetone kinase-like protein
VSANAISTDDFLKIMKNTLKVMKANEEYLAKLDADIGDADHGANMVRGFKLVKERLTSLEKPDVGKIFNTTGMALMETVGGAAGPLYGQMFVKAGRLAKEKMEVKKRDLADMWEAGLRGVQDIGGGATPGGKTMVDVLDPAVKVLKESANNDGITLMETLKEVREVAKENAKRTIPMLAKWGRASYLGERSKGHQDPGATSSYLILRTILDTLNGEVGVKIAKYAESDGGILEEAYL